MRAAYAAKSRLPLCPDGAKFPSFPARHFAPSKGKKSITSDALFADGFRFPIYLIEKQLSYPFRHSVPPPLTIRGGIGGWLRTTSPYG